MPDLGMSVLVNRSLLGLPDLELNDFVNYYVGAQFMGGAESFQRTQVGSPFTDGQVTTYRTKQNVSEPISVEVLGGDVSEVRANVAALLDAFNQDNFTVNITIGPESFQYSFEAADVTIPMTGARWLANQLQINFTAIRKPWVLTGVSF